MEPSINVVPMGKGEYVGRTVTDRVRLDDEGFEGGTIRGDIGPARVRLARVDIWLTVAYGAHVQMVATPEERSLLGELADLFEWAG